jgi:hypothetical protein
MIFMLGWRYIVNYNFSTWYSANFILIGAAFK